MIPRVLRCIVTIEGPGWTDLDEMELAELPGEGEPIQTKRGICLVTHADHLPEGRAARRQDRLPTAVTGP